MCGLTVCRWAHCVQHSALSPISSPHSDKYRKGTLSPLTVSDPVSALLCRSERGDQGEHGEKAQNEINSSSPGFVFQQPHVWVQLPSGSQVASARQKQPGEGVTYASPGPTSEALTQPLGGVQTVTSPSDGGCPVEPGLEALLEEAPPPLAEDEAPVPSPSLPLGLGIFFGGSPFPSRTAWAPTVSQRILNAGAGSRPGLREENSCTQNGPRGEGSSLTRVCVSISSWAPSVVAALPPRARAAWSDIVAAGFSWSSKTIPGSRSSERREAVGRKERGGGERRPDAS